MQPSEAAITDPILSLTLVEGVAAGPNTLLRFEGDILAADLINVEYPLHLVVRDDTTGAYLRIDVSVGGFSGVEPGLAGGMDSDEALDLLSVGTPLPGVEVVYVGDGRVDVLIPSGSIEGELRATVFALYKGDALLSNTLPLQIEEATP